MNLKYHISEMSIKCPYCDKECRDDDCVVSIDSRVEFECEHCEKVFYAEAHISYDTHSDCTLNNEEHDLKSSESHPTVFNCENCSHYEVKKD